MDYSGQRYHFLTAIRPLRAEKRGSDQRIVWLARCDCGNAVEVVWSASKGKRSCGCTRKNPKPWMRTHGMSKHPAYFVWRSMMDRCRLPSHQAWRNYGGRGIKVCDRWHQFENFWADMGPSYASGLSLDRIDNNSGYSPENCRWTDRTTQARNTRTNHMLDTPWGHMTAKEAATMAGLNYTTLLYRLDAGWSTTEALLRPTTSSTPDPSTDSSCGETTDP